jgi:hypothetical protein
MDARSLVDEVKALCEDLERGRCSTVPVSVSCREPIENDYDDGDGLIECDDIDTVIHDDLVAVQVRAACSEEQELPHAPDEWSPAIGR